MIELQLRNKIHNNIKFNQYDRNYDIEIELIDYSYKENDIIKIEWIVNNKIVIIQSGSEIKINDNIITFPLRREVTLNDGEGYFNVVVENTFDESRKATFKSKFEIIGNSIDENTVETALVETVIENLNNAENTANEINSILLQTIDIGDINNYAKIIMLDDYVKLREGYDLSKNNFSDNHKAKLEKLYYTNTYGSTSVADADLITEDFQAYVSNMKNTPSAYGLLKCKITFNGHLRQTFETRGNNNIYTRHRVSGAEWGQWTRYAMSSIPDIARINTPNFTCPDTVVTKYSNTLNWYEVRNGICYLHMDINVYDGAVNTYGLFPSGLPIPDTEIWFGLNGQSINYKGRTASLRVTTGGGITIDNVSASGRFMGSVSYPVSS